jgi:TonB family protein
MAMPQLNPSTRTACPGQGERQLSRIVSKFFRCVVCVVGLGVFLCGEADAAKEKESKIAAERAQASRAFKPVYPYEALIAGRGGWAEIGFTVDSSGRAILASPVGSSEPAFAHSFMADLEAIEFSPPRKNGQPLMSIGRERFEFPAKPPLDAVASQILAELRKPEPALTPVAELDAKPEPIRQPVATYPWVLRGDEISGEAEIEFVIDRNGRTLFPRIVSATHEDFGWAAATAVLNWRYKSPLKAGVKVDTRITEKIVYDIKKAPEMW